MTSSPPSSFLSKAVFEECIPYGISNIEFSPFDLKQSFRYNAELSRKRRDVVAALVGALLVDTQEELIGAWKNIIGRHLQPEEVAELGRMPLSEREALQLAAGDWKKPAVRNGKKIEWQTWAQEKYKRLAHGKGLAGNATPGSGR